MKTQRTKWLGWLLLASCSTACYFFKTVLTRTPEPQRLLDLKNDFCWVGNHETRAVRLTIDSSGAGIWFKARLTLAPSDTVFLKGFEKGDEHPAWRMLADGRTSEVIFISMHDLRADTVEIVNHSRTDFGFLPPSLLLFKMKK